PSVASTMRASYFPDTGWYAASTLALACKQHLVLWRWQPACGLPFASDSSSEEPVGTGSDADPSRPASAYIPSGGPASSVLALANTGADAAASGTSARL